MSELEDLKVGTIVKFSKFQWSTKLPEGDKWGVMLETVGLFPDGMVYMRDPDGNWSSKVMHVGGDDEFEIVDETEVPEDIPDDFWPLVARCKLLGGDQA